MIVGERPQLVERRSGFGPPQVSPGGPVADLLAFQSFNRVQPARLGSSDSTPSTTVSGKNIAMDGHRQPDPKRPSTCCVLGPLEVFSMSDPARRDKMMPVEQTGVSRSRIGIQIFTPLPSRPHCIDTGDFETSFFMVVVVQAFI